MLPVRSVFILWILNHETSPVRHADVCAYARLSTARSASFARRSVLPHLVALLDALFVASKEPNSSATDAEPDVDADAEQAAAYAEARRRRRRAPHATLRLSRATLHLIAFLAWYCVHFVFSHRVGVVKSV